MNGKSTKTVIRMFWAWSNEKEERWLSRMAREGWHLAAPRGVYYRFEKGAPADVVYRLDYQNPKKADRNEYLNLFRDAGWDHAGEFANWQYFRTAAGDGPPPEIHTDPESRMAMYRRVLALLAVIFIAVWAPAVTNIGRPEPSGTFWIIVRLSQGLLTLLWTYAIIRLGLKIREIRRGRCTR
jgi:hypothetical protein